VVGTPLVTGVVTVPADGAGEFDAGAEVAGGVGEGAAFGGAVLCRGAIGFGWVPRVTGTDTGATATTVAGAAVTACTGGTTAELVPPARVAAQPTTNAAANATTTTIATRSRPCRERQPEPGSCAADDPPRKP
jgi:hypothetical protein